MAEPPLDDPRWCPLETAIELRRRQTDNLPLTIIELDRGLASGELRSMRRRVGGGKAERLFAAFWSKRLGIDSVYFPRGLDSFVSPPRITFHPTSAHEAVGRVEGWMYYVWKPDLMKLRSSAITAEPQPKPDKPKGDWQVARVKELLPIVYPDGVPANRKLKEIQSDLEPECEKRGWKVPSPDSIARALGRRKSPG